MNSSRTCQICQADTTVDLPKHDDMAHERWAFQNFGIKAVRYEYRHLFA